MMPWLMNSRPGNGSIWSATGNARSSAWSSRIGGILIEGVGDHPRAQPSAIRRCRQASRRSAAGKKPALRRLALVFPALILLSLGAGAYLYLRPVACTAAAPHGRRRRPDGTGDQRHRSRRIPRPGHPPLSSPHRRASVLGTSAATAPSTAPASAAPEPATPTPAQPNADERAWLEATDAGTVQAWRQYLNAFPDGAHAADARQRAQAADDKAFAAALGAGTVVALNQYLTLFPDGAQHVAQAQASLAALEQQAADQKPSASARRFDGTWQIAIVCQASGKAENYTIQFPAQVKDGNLHAQYQTEGKPGSLTLDGRIQADGSADIYAHGLTGNSRYTPGALPPGSPIGYHIQAKFDGSSGTGSRVEIAPVHFFTALKR